MDVRSAMTPAVVTVGPSHTLQQAAQKMAEHNVGSAIIIDPDGLGPGIITERDVLRAVAKGDNPSEAVVGDYLTDEATVCEPGASLVEAAGAMVRGGFRHIVVVEGSRVVGILSMRDVVRRWLQE
ncbi:MAG: CBS domain-containing protein [Actinomycetota bacterium]|nr:CBS domain-containing protein [Actinomycetota bacterium]